MDSVLLHRQAKARKNEALETSQPTFYSDIFSCIVVEQSILSVFIVFSEM
jgi:hypothetical protein